MGKFFPTSARHAKALEFLELRQGTMTKLQFYVLLRTFIKFLAFVENQVSMNIKTLHRFWW